MAYISVAKATEYFTGTRNLAEWNAIDDANKGNLLQRASQRIESVPFKDDNPNRTSPNTVSYTHLTLPTTPYV